jgi:hypothetical protein
LRHYTATSVQCATTESGARTISIRVGLNAGEPIEEVGDSSVPPSSRIAHVARRRRRDFAPEPVCYLLSGKSLCLPCGIRHEGFRQRRPPWLKLAGIAPRIRTERHYTARPSFTVSVSVTQTRGGGGYWSPYSILDRRRPSSTLTRPPRRSDAVAETS